jgi:minor extracellular serine protease Vpr
MRTRLPREPVHALTLALFAAVVALILIAAGGNRSSNSTALGAPSWQGLAGSRRPRVAVGQRVIVLLKARSLADRLGDVGGLATDEQERRWTATALASQKLLISRLAVEGVAVAPEYSYTHVVNGFSAAFDANGLALLERTPEVAGVYPVRAAYPASIPAALTSQLAPGFGHPPDTGLSSEDGTGVTVAVLDTGVDHAQPFLRGRVERGIDIVGQSPGAEAAAKPDEPSVVERHGTEMAGLIVGSGGPDGMAGVAPGATVLPIRVAGWQRDASGQWSVYGRTDQVLAGLDRAVDPNDDGDAHDAARVALVALSEPFAAFADGPLALAAQGALRLDTLVVAPAGNDGPGGPSYGSISGPGGAGSALTVGAADLRARYAQARVVVRAGLSVELDQVVPLAAPTFPRKTVDSGVGAPRTAGAPGQQPPAGGSVPLVNFFDNRGRKLVAGRAALVPLDSDPATTFSNAALAGAAAVLFYGGSIPGGALRLDQSAPIPAVSIPDATAQAILGQLRAGIPVTVSIGSADDIVNSAEDHVAHFSSTGLAFDGRVKPEIVAPGVGLGTSEPNGSAGPALYGTVNGTSAAAAVVAGDAALLAQARPDLDAESLKGVLVGAAQPLPNDPVSAQGAGLVDLGGAAATEMIAFPTSLALGRATSANWRTTQQLQLRNVSVRRLRVSLAVDVVREGAAAIDFKVRPSAFFLGAGRTINFRLTASVTSAVDGDTPVQGYLVVQPEAGNAIRIPWVITFGPPDHAALNNVRLSSHAFKPSDVAPALLSFVAGAVPRSDNGQDVQAVQQLDLELWSATGGRIGLLARMRDVLPGRYSYGVTGRDPTGSILPTGDYVLKLIAYPTDGSGTTVRTIPFTIK